MSNRIRDLFIDVITYPCPNIHDGLVHLCSLFVNSDQDMNVKPYDGPVIRQ